MTPFLERMFVLYMYLAPIFMVFKEGLCNLDLSILDPRQWLCFVGYKRFEIKGTIVFCREDVYCHLHEDMKAVMYELSLQVKDNPDVRHVESVDITSTVMCNGINSEVLNIPIQKRYIMVSTGVWGCVSKIEECGEHRNRSHSTHSITQNITITLCSKNYIAIQEYIVKARDQWLRYKQGSITGQMCYVVSCSHHHIQPVVTPYAFTSKKTFTSLYGKCKDTIRDKIEHFESVKGIERSAKLEIPHTLGMLFHGVPGSGKTSTIKAIANFTKRHIVIIRMDKFIECHPSECIDILKQVFFKTNINDIDIPQDKRLYVFEEADTWSDIINCRKNDVVKHDTTSICVDDLCDALTVSDDDEGQQMLMQKQAAKIATKLAAKQSSKKIDKKHLLGGLLELLDGIIEMPGRMCIMTTNHPERLDNALTRPGRFGDIIVKFEKLAPKQLEECQHALLRFS